MDITLCNGVLEDDSLCPLADHCIRFREHLKRDEGPHWYIKSGYDGICENFVETFKNKKNERK